LASQLGIVGRTPSAADAAGLGGIVGFSEGIPFKALVYRSMRAVTFQILGNNPLIE
jgi:hypothetical protein